MTDPNIRDRFRNEIEKHRDTPGNYSGQSRNLSGFKYGGDIGVNSIPGLTALANSSGITLAVVSSYRPGDAGYHGSQNAIDLSGSTESMRIVASYLEQYHAYLLELIHTNFTVKGGGFYVHNGVIVPQEFYDGPDITTGGNIIQGHVDHIHLAATMDGLRAAAANSERLRQEMSKTRLYDYLTGEPGQVGGAPRAGTNLNDIGEKGRGCFVRTANAVLLLAGLSYQLYTLIDIFGG